MPSGWRSYITYRPFSFKFLGILVSDYLSSVNVYKNYRLIFFMFYIYLIITIMYIVIVVPKYILAPFF